MAPTLLFVHTFKRPAARRDCSPAACTYSRRSQSPCAPRSCDAAAVCRAHRVETDGGSRKQKSIFLFSFYHMCHTVVNYRHIIPGHCLARLQ